jgi:hypothetical protein
LRLHTGSAGLTEMRKGAESPVGDKENQNGKQKWEEKRRSGRYQAKTRSAHLHPIAGATNSSPSGIAHVNSI